MSREGFLSRWSRRKAEAREAERESAPWLSEDAPEPTPPVTASDAAPEVAPDSEPEGAPEIVPDSADGGDVPLDLPDIDSLTKESDYTVFLKENVPSALRKQALRKLWRSDPLLANLDGLNDYDDDFTNPTVTGAAVRTAYDALRGYAKPEDEIEASQGMDEGGEAFADDVPSSSLQPDADIALQQENPSLSSIPAPSCDGEYEENEEQTIRKT